MKSKCRQGIQIRDQSGVVWVELAIVMSILTVMLIAVLGSPNASWFFGGDSLIRSEVGYDGSFLRTMYLPGVRVNPVNGYIDFAPAASSRALIVSELSRVNGPGTYCVHLIETDCGAFWQVAQSDIFCPDLPNIFDSNAALALSRQNNCGKEYFFTIHQGLIGSPKYFAIQADTLS